MTADQLYAIGLSMLLAALCAIVGWLISCLAWWLIKKILNLRGD